MSAVERFKKLSNFDKLFIIGVIFLIIPIMGFIFGMGSWLLILIFNWFPFFEISDVTPFTTGATVVGCVFGAMISFVGIVQLIE